MILSANEIEAKLKAGEISITPFDTSNLKPASYMLTLGRVLRKLKPVPELDAREEPEVEELLIPDDGYLLQPGEHILGITAEIVGLSKKYSCLLSNRAGLAMLGLDVSQSSFYCEPGTTHAYTMEMVNNGPLPVRLFSGLRIAKAVFVTVA